MAAPSRPYETKTVRLAAGHSLRYHEWPGPGPAVILLHGSSGYGLMWQGVADALGDRFHVFAPDQRGHGDSDRPDGDYSAEEYAEDVHQFIQALGLGRAVVGGHSLGGRVAQVFGAVHPEECLGLVLVGIHLSNFFQERERMVRVLESGQRMLLAPTEFASREAALEYLRGSRPHDTEESHAQRIDCNMVREGQGYRFKYDKVRVAQSLVHQCANLRKYASAVTSPVVLLRSTRGSELESMAAARDLARCWKDATVMEVEGDYLLHVGSPGTTASALAEFIDGHVPS